MKTHALVDAELRELLLARADLEHKMALLNSRIRAKRLELDKTLLPTASCSATALCDAQAPAPEVQAEPVEPSKRARVDATPGRPATVVYPPGVCKACWRRKLKLPGGPPHVRDSTCRLGPDGPPPALVD